MQLKAHLEACSPRELLDSFSMLFKAAGYVADSSAELLTMLGRTSALIVHVGPFWLKSWSGDAASKLCLCDLQWGGGEVGTFSHSG